ncbi:hypothetical protein KPG66_07545 [Mycetohabitans sp. B2]|uniref:Tc toxin subunit A n=1 Tax=Mycetohabitans sp. B2 TaxID=2841274 RepID=UPI001F3AFDD6|nr:Tc toxin subunit A [Mycetohabitans sp. B2]MCF7695959.1 hypothetical protein [Mycetohabitans sp. B2]
MNQTTLPLLSRVEKLHSLEEGQLVKLGYPSVFDVVRVPRERFIRQHRAQLGRRAEKVYDLAIGYAQQVVHHFRYKRITRAVRSTLSGPFSVPGPSFSTQFPDTNWQNKAPSGAPEANDAPVAYLTHIYELALQQEKAGASQLMNTLAERRPDLGKLKVDDAAINEVIPQLQLVNEILAAAIQDKKQLNNLEAVNALLATTRYPNTLPYHYGHQQIQAAQSVLDTSLQEAVLPLSGAFPQHFWAVAATLSQADASGLTRLQIMASQLSPEQQKIVAEPAWFGNHHLGLAELQNTWQSPSFAETLPFIYYDTGAFILPLQDSVDEYDGRPKELCWLGYDYKYSNLKIQLTNGSKKAIVDLRGQVDNYYNTYPGLINDAIDTEGSPYPNKLLLQFVADDNPDLDLSQGPWYGQFTLNFLGWRGGRRDLTISLCLSQDDKVHYSPAQTGFYQANYGSSSLTAANFVDMTALTARTGLTVPAVEQLLCVDAGGFRVTLSDNFTVANALFSNGHTSHSAAEPFLYGARFIHAGQLNTITISKDPSSGALTLNNLTDDKLDRINRMVRLQKWLDLPYEDIDLLVTSAMDAEGDANRALLMNDNTLRMLGVFKHYQTTYGVSAKQFAAWLDVVTPFAITPNTPFLDQVFNASGAFDTPFVVDNQDFVYTLTTGEDGARVQHISTALGLNHRQFLLFADPIARQQGNVSLCQLTCNLSVVSAFYRLATLARTLSLSAEAFCVLLNRLDNGTGVVWKQLAGQPIITPPQQDSAIGSDALTLLQALSTIAQWQQQHSLPMPTVQLLTTPCNPFLPVAGNYGTVSTTNEMQRVSVGWKDLNYDSSTGELTLTQQIAFREDQNAYGISEFHFTIPNGLSRNGDLSWQGDAPPGVTLNNDKYDGKTNDWPFIWSNWLYPDKTKTYILNISLKGTFQDLAKLNALSSTVKIHTAYFDTTLTFFEGAILTDGTELAPQGTTDQLNFIQQVWQTLQSTWIDAAQLNRSGAPVKDSAGQAIDWFSLLSAQSKSGAGLIDADGLVTDVDINNAVTKSVNSVSLSDADKQQAITALTNTLLQAQQTQQGVAVGLLAQSLNVSQSLPALLLRWSDQTVYRWLSATWALKKTVKAAADIPAGYLRSLREVVRRALLTTQFGLSAALVQTLLGHPEYFGLTREDLTRIDLPKLYLLSRYSDLLAQVGAAGGGTEDDVLAYFRAANAASPLSNADAASLLASLLGWQQEQVQASWSVLGGIAKTMPQLDTVLRLQQAQKQTGLGVGQQQQGFVLSRDSAYEDWQSVGRALVVGVSHLKGDH